jgi:hypothetical protein
MIVMGQTPGGSGEGEGVAGGAGGGAGTCAGGLIRRPRPAFPPATRAYDRHAGFGLPALVKRPVWIAHQLRSPR